MDIKILKIIGFTLLIALLSIGFGACSKSPSAPETQRSTSLITYRGTIDNEVYELEIIRPPLSRAVIPQQSDEFILQAGGKAKGGTVSNCSVDGTGVMVLVLKGNNTNTTARENDTFEARVHQNGGLLGFTGTIIWDEESEPTELPEELEPIISWGISISVPDGEYTFPESQLVYVDIVPYTVTIMNTGDKPTGKLDITTSNENFILSRTSIANIARNDGATFTIKPQTRLTTGTYSCEVTISGDNAINAVFTVNFTVAETFAELIMFGGIQWRVLAVENGQALIISEKVLEERQFHYTAVNITWAESSLRNYLNGQFYNRFTQEEKRRIMERTLSTGDNPYYNTPGGEDTQDFVFSLSLEEVLKYFIAPGMSASEIGTNNVISDDNDTERIAFDRGDRRKGYWLRSMGMNGTYGAYVNNNGVISLTGFRVDDGVSGIRPAMWISL
jgi:hypothetical protein